MRIYHVYCRNENHEAWSVGTTLMHMVIIARSASNARAVAADNAHDEGAEVWTNPSLTNCALLGEAIPHENRERVVVFVLDKDC